MGNENVLNRPTLIKFSRHPPTFDNLNGIPVNETPSLSITSISFTLCRRRNFIANFFFSPSLHFSLSLPSFSLFILFLVFFCGTPFIHDERKLDAYFLLGRMIPSYF